MVRSRMLIQLTELVADTLNKRSLMMASTESCTDGLVSVIITDVSGSSARPERGFVVYSNETKSWILGVPAALIRGHGVVSEPVAYAMAEGAVLNGRMQVTVIITDVAGPTDGTPNKPVSTMHFGWNNRLQARMETHYFKGDRKQVRLQAAGYMLCGLLDFLGSAKC